MLFQVALQIFHRVGLYQLILTLGIEVVDERMQSHAATLQGLQAKQGVVDAAQAARTLVIVAQRILYKSLRIFYVEETSSFTKWT